MDQDVWKYFFKILIILKNKLFNLKNETYERKTYILGCYKISLYSVGLLQALKFQKFCLLKQNYDWIRTNSMRPLSRICGRWHVIKVSVNATVWPLVELSNHSVASSASRHVYFYASQRGINQNKVCCVLG